MALYIYTRKENIPEGKAIIRDNEQFFNTHDITYNQVSKDVIRNVELGEYKDKYSFFDRKGIALYVDNFSTGTKTLLNINSYPEKVFLIDEAGDNAIREFSKFKNGAIYCEHVRSNMADLFLDAPQFGQVYIDNILCETWEELNYAL